MSDATKSTAATATPTAKPARKRPQPAPEVKGSPEAKRMACLVLEVLSGLRSPASASGVAGIAPQRYYALETRALQAIVQALEPRPKGPRHRPETERDRVLKRCERLERELRRAHALLRTAQRTIGLGPPKETEVTRKDKSGKERRHKRRPQVRARKTVDALRESITREVAGPAPANGAAGGA